MAAVAGSHRGHPHLSRTSGGVLGQVADVAGHIVGYERRGKAGVELRLRHCGGIADSLQPHEKPEDWPIQRSHPQFPTPWWRKGSIVYAWACSQASTCRSLQLSSHSDVSTP